MFVVTSNEEKVDTEERNSLNKMRMLTRNYAGINIFTTLGCFICSLFINILLMLFELQQLCTISSASVQDNKLSMLYAQKVLKVSIYQTELYILSNKKILMDSNCV